MLDRVVQILRTRSAEARAAKRPYIVGVGGSVAVGKSTFAGQLAEAIAAWPADVVNIATDGFLFSNAVLAGRNISMRKGFPESYDVAALRCALEGVRNGIRVALPRYSHVTYDVDSGNPMTVERPDVLILDGLHLAQIEQAGAARLIDTLIYLDAEESAIEGWFTDRLLPLMIAGRDDPQSFYYRFRDWDDAQRADFAKRVWEGINLPNLRDHIVKDRDAADFVLRKDAEHGIADIAGGAA
ncbi:MAG: type I pantothenate kinase [Proteobacteria bacterium]|nr:type I pantothenate kinase [Pseudomonadota bacterium]